MTTTSKQAEVIWASGKITIQNVVRETETMFVTDDPNQTRWWKKDGMRVGSMRYVKVGLRRRSFFDQATAKMI